jgi:hypothetical protein
MVLDGSFPATPALSGPSVRLLAPLSGVPLTCGKLRMGKTLLPEGER